MFPSSPNLFSFSFPFFFWDHYSIVEFVRDITLTNTGGGTPTTRSGIRRGGIFRSGTGIRHKALPYHHIHHYVRVIYLPNVLIKAFASRVFDPVFSLCIGAPHRDSPTRFEVGSTIDIDTSSCLHWPLESEKRKRNCWLRSRFQLDCDLISDPILNRHPQFELLWRRIWTVLVRINNHTRLTV